MACMVREDCVTLKLLQIDEELETLTNLQYDHMIKTTSIPPTEMINTERLSVVASKLDQVLIIPLLCLRF